jgi:hypothetical protein
MGVRGRSVAGHLGQDRGAPAQRSLSLLEDQAGRPLSDHEPVTTGVEGSRRCGGVPVATRQGLHGGEAGHGDLTHGSLAPAADHGVGPAHADQVEGLADGLGRRRAGGDRAGVVAPGPPFHGHLPGHHVGQHHGQGVGADPLRAPGRQDAHPVLQGPDPPDAGAVDHPDAVGVAGHVELRLLEGFGRGAQSELHHTVEVTGPAAAEALGAVEAADLGGDPHGQAGGVEQGDGSHPGAPRDHTGPGVLDGLAERCHGPHPGHHDPAVEPHGISTARDHGRSGAAIGPS